MKVIQVRDVPDEVHAELRRRALDAGESLSDYLRRELERVAERPTNAEALIRAASRRGGASRSQIHASLDAARAGR